MSKLMCCNTCGNSPRCESKELFRKCLEDCEKSFVHPLYPEKERWSYFKYNYWRPKEEIKMLLTDKDFELC